MTENSDSASSKSTRKPSLFSDIRIWVSFGALINFLVSFITHVQIYIVISTCVLIVLFIIRIIDLILSQQVISWKYYIGIGVMAGFVITFSLFKPNRNYFFEAFAGTPTPSQIPTSICEIPPTHTPTPTNTNTPTATATWTPTSTSTSTPTFTNDPTQIPTNTSFPLRVILPEEFLNNDNDWELPLIQYPPILEAGKIIGGKLEYELMCSNYYSYPCLSWLTIPNITERDFDLRFTPTIMKISPFDSKFRLGIRFRNSNEGHYIIYISNKNTVSVDMKSDGVTKTLIKEKYDLNISLKQGETSSFRIVVKDSTYSLYENDMEIITFEDGNIMKEGAIDLGFYLPELGSYAKIEMDDLEIHETP